MRHGERAGVIFSGTVHMTWTVERDGVPCPVVKLYTDDDECMVIPAKYVVDDPVTIEVMLSAVRKEDGQEQSDLAVARQTQ